MNEILEGETARSPRSFTARVNFAARTARRNRGAAWPSQDILSLH